MTTPQLATDKVPQADKPERVIDFVEHLANGDLNTDTLGLHRRDIAHYVHAAQLVGFVSGKRKFTPAGYALLTLPKEAQLARMALAFEESDCGRAWLIWANVDRLPQLDPGTADAFLGGATNLAPNTARRRATTLRRWWEKLTPHHPSCRHAAADAARSSQV